MESADCLCLQQKNINNDIRRLKSRSWLWTSTNM